MSWLRTPLAPVALAFATGIALTATMSTLLWWALWLTGIGVAVVTLVVHRLVWATGALLVAVVAIGALRAVPSPAAVDDVARLAIPRDATVDGVVVGDAVRRTPEQQRLFVDVDRLDGTPASGRVQLTVYGAAAALQEGQRVSARVRLRRADGHQNPDGFDYAAFLGQRGVHVVGGAQARAVRVVDRTTPWNVELRRRAVAAIDAALPPVSAALLGGLLLGARGELPPDVQDAFRRAGVYHVLAVSGFNVALVASAVFTAVLFARGSRRLAAAVAIGIVLGFAIVVGSQPSVLRATVMGVLVLVAILLDREASVVNSVALAGLAILAVRPGDLYDPGFQLSFAATLGIVMAPVPTGILGAVGVSLAAQAAVLPITLAHFNQVSTISIVANLGVVPLAGVATILGLAGISASAVSASAASVVFDATWPVLLALRGVVRLAALTPGALVHLPAPHWLAIAAYSTGVAAAWVGWNERTVRPRLARALGAMAFWLLAGAAFGAAWPVVRPGDGRLHVATLDVGRGLAVVVEAPTRETVVVAAGIGPDTAERTVAPYLWNRGVRTLAAVITDTDGGQAEQRLRRLFDVRATGAIQALGPVLVTVVREPARAGRAIGVDRPGRAIGLDHPGRRIAGDRAGQVMEDDRPGRAIEDDRPGRAIDFDYGLASIRVVLDPGVLGTTGHATVLITGLDRGVDAVRRSLSQGLPAAVGVIAVGSRDRDRDSLDSVSSRVPVYRTDRDGAVLVVTDGRVVEATRWSMRVTDRYCLDPESPCPTLAGN